VRGVPVGLIKGIDNSSASEELPLASHSNAVRFEVFANNKGPGGVGRISFSFASPTVTPDGFILVGRSRMAGTPDHRFRIMDSAGDQQNILVCFGRSLVARVDQQRRAHLWIGSRFWALCATAHLAAYLVDAGDYPPNGQLLIDELSEDEMLLAAYWRDDATRSF
jgi:hypothetical protein